MAASPENSPRQESEIEAEKPRTGAVILTTRTYLGKLLNESLNDKKLKLADTINQSRRDRSKLASVTYRYWLEYGKEDALNYALNYQSNVENELKLKKNMSADDYLEQNSDIPIKTPQEIVQARIIISKCVDLAYSQARWHKIETNRRYTEGYKPIQTAEQFARVAGFYQGLSYLLGMENDGGMDKLINRSDPKDFRVPPHP